MVCNICNKIMRISGTSYEQLKSKEGHKQFLHKRYCECERCRNRKYINSKNFQEIFERETHQRKR